MAKTLVLVIAMALAVVGCRREDVREVVIEVPNLTEAQSGKVKEALKKYAGVRCDEIACDFAARKITVVYDSMQVAQTNLRMALEEKGFKVVTPANQTGRAGH